ncbi:MAG: cytochrome c [Paracoccaceae bacterium]
MSFRKLPTVLFAGLSLALSVPASAQEVSLGKSEFNTRCAVCHGEGGKGDGMVGALFAQKPSDLTLLAKNNNGAYPFSEVYQAIDGGREIAAHGQSEMPIWGDFFMADIKEDRPSTYGRTLEAVKQGRILSVVYYLQTLQQ